MGRGKLDFSKGEGGFLKFRWGGVDQKGVVKNYGEEMGWDPGMDEAMTLGIKSHFFTPFVAKKVYTHQTYFHLLQYKQKGGMSA